MAANVDSEKSEHDLCWPGIQMIWDRKLNTLLHCLIYGGLGVWHVTNTLWSTLKPPAQSRSRLCCQNSSDMASQGSLNVFCSIRLQDVSSRSFIWLVFPQHVLMVSDWIEKFGSHINSNSENRPHFLHLWMGFGYSRPFCQFISCCQTNPAHLEFHKTF